ncbi:MULTISPECIES: SMI1/KNR4 family protein [Stenotrophomonas]|uniref:SMI1/KNR4 family protein n=1 Tax=Stenotrophomonas maltophilia TaxID=40324 RepID=A0A2J0UGJ0_STEMA|nr:MULTISPECIES: SMI1/KNR4 family protein [Stenotrophomonas]PJL33963.1 SMI1/KNR4 family protein [Stenotrophomonas maltophilia]HDS1148580.1 SMI1/KNR4 family protein [Stenotrophomonas maltophilia]HDS1162522.1 SMI1/KNR4 family protein [Stenotrophomonas maltophilia]HEL5404246.1 SMI1/KNR4 family protein [Stenotrophomonas maltophilia]
MNLVDRFLSGLVPRLPADDAAQWAHVQGASTEDLQRLRTQWPQVPDSLVALLSRVDGTHFREYPGAEVCVLMLGSDVEDGGYPYYLRSVAQIFEDQQQWDDSIRSIYEEWLDDEPEILGEGIDADLAMNRRLCFSHCMNNGGTSMLYLDFDPAPGGTAGQVVRYLHDPDSYAVIAPSFDAYLQQLIDGGYAFIDEEL